MTGNALSKLSALVETATDPSARAEALAKLGIGFAQLGRIAEASDILKELRVKCSAGQYARASIGAIVLEGVIGYYDDRNLLSLDRLIRASALARSLRIKDVETEAAVWLAHLSFNFERYDLLSTAISTAFDGFDLLDDSLRARVCLVVADGYQFLGRTEVSATWYGLSRIFARRTNDRAVMVAIEFNRLMIGLGRARVECYLPIPKARSIHLDWLSELSSVQRLHQGLGANALRELLLLCDTLIAETMGDYAQALKSLIEIRSAQAASKCGMSEEFLGLEIEWCRVMSGAIGLSVGYKLPELGAIESMSMDEQVVAVKFVEDIHARCGFKIDVNRVSLIRSQAIAHCLKVDEAALAALSVSEKYMISTQNFAKKSNSDSEPN